MAYISNRSHREQPVSSIRGVPSRIVNAREENIEEPNSDSDDDDDEDDESNAYLLYAQNLNNNAALCIEVGYYDKATQSLQKALEFSQRLSDDSLTKVCSCNGCKVDGCIDFSADFAPTNSRCRIPVPKRRSGGHDDLSDSSEEEDNYTRKRNMSNEDIHRLTKSISCPKVQKLALEQRNQSREGGIGKNASWSLQEEYCDEELNRDDDNEIYKRPIRAVRDGHQMGSTLFLVITFNLALTNHLEVADAFNRKPYDTKSAQKALLFYDLTSKHERKMLNESHNCWDSISSLRFNKILNSNLEQLLQYLPEKSLHTAQCLVPRVHDSIDRAAERLSGRSQRQSKSTKEGTTASKTSTSHRNGNSDSKIRRTRTSRDSGDSRESRSRKSMQRSQSRDSMDVRMSPYSNKSSLRSSRKGTRTSTSRSKLQNALGDLAPAL